MISPIFFVVFGASVVFADKFNPSLSMTKGVVPNKFIIEVEPTSTLNKRGVIVHPLDLLYQEINSRDIDLQVTTAFKMDGIFNGAAVIVKKAEDFALLKNTPGVKAIRPVRVFSKAKFARHEMSNRADPNPVPPPHILGGVDKVHAEGNTGTGVKIGIIDSGIDYNHPDFGSNGFGPGKKLAIGYDFAGNDYDALNPDSIPKPKHDPMDCNGHGTHVAGIIYAQPGNPYNITGVAYGATLGVYKIFGCAGETSDDLVMEALQRGLNDSMDILTLSVGDESGWSSSASAVLVDRISKKKGTIITASAGNTGESGSWSTDSPATSKEVISIGSVDNTIIPLQNATVHGADHPPITYFSGPPLNISGSLPIYATSTNTSTADDACSPLSKDAPDLSNYLVVIRRGGCPFVDKLANAAAKGAKAMLIYDNGTEFTSIFTEGYTAAMIKAADGEFLVNEFAAGRPINISFPQVGGATELQDDHGGLMSIFSSSGPSFDFCFKPALSAPGGNIMSTLPLVNGSYGVFSGTSMSTPFVAGAAALLLAAKPGSLSALQVPNGIRTLFQTTSTKILASKNGAGFDTLSKAGAGLINVYNAIHTTTVVSPGELILNDTAHFQGNHTIVIQNIGGTPKGYTLKHVPALTALTMKENSILPSVGPVPLDPTAAIVHIEPAEFTVQAGASQQVAINFTLPTTLDPRRYPLYSGFIDVTSDSETQHVSYIGLGASLKDHQIFDNTTAFMQSSPPSILNPIGKVVTNFTLDKGDRPRIVWRLAMGTPAISFDLLESGSDVSVGILGSRLYSPRNDENPISGLPYHDDELVRPCFMDGKTIPNGQYRLRVRALRIAGDPKSEGDYDSLVSSIIGINVPPSTRRECNATVHD